MNRWTLRLGLSLMVTVAIWTHPVSAQVLVVPPLPYEPLHHPYQPPPFTQRHNEPSAKPLHRCLNKHGLACEPTVDGTGNFHSEFRFIFSSSRGFFGEGCVPTHPGPPHRWWR